MPQSWENQQCDCKCARQPERKHVRKCNPLTVQRLPLDTPTCYIHTHPYPSQRCLGGISDILHFNCGPLSCDDLIVNKPGRRKTPLRFRRRKSAWLTPEPFIFMALPCFASHSTFHPSRRHLSHRVPVFRCNQGGYYLKYSTHQKHSLHCVFWLTAWLQSLDTQRT